MKQVRVPFSVFLVGAFFVVVVVLSPAPFAKVLAQDEDDYPAYLPLILSAPGSNDTIPNGDFEAGRTIWTESSRWGNVLIVQDDDLPPGIGPHGGAWAAWLGGDNDEEASIVQTVFVDPAYPYLAYWHWIDWPFSCEGASGAVATVWLAQTIVYQSDVCEDTTTDGWTRQVIDVSAFAGQSTELRFELTTGSNSYANLYLDNVTLQSAP